MKCELPEAGYGESDLRDAGETPFEFVFLLSLPSVAKILTGGSTVLYALLESIITNLFYRYILNNPSYHVYNEQRAAQNRAWTK